ncbi:hypothetical protein FZC78_07575 [Rossellomorea vietnamensis]|uniref:Uncharacterized protein n=1 Tax=Rossellomorea vietnamensis TaxID=218284 RepID=A0A5D4NYC2_9BACI|nr:hypothetical protein [Rossellomorea vietnamensis]TYS17712.1 hypothetical protein FZC78_07575 [Rossellomorea vietnamensis]
MSDVRDGDCFLALDTNLLVNSNFFTEENKYVRFIVSQNAINFFENAVKENTENSELAQATLQRLEIASQQGFNISTVIAYADEVKELGLEHTFPATVMASFYYAAIDAEQKNNRRLFVVTLPGEQEGISIANHLGLPTYIMQV